MKRLVALVTLGILLTTCSLAQISFGVKGGINFATLGGADVPSGTKSRTGFTVGGYVTISLPMLFTIQPEILYTTKGNIYEQNLSLLGQPVATKQTITNSYIEIPVLVKYSLPVPVINPSLYVGPAVGFLASAKSKFEETGAQTTESDFKSFVTNTDFGLAFGASAHVLVADLDVRYTMGLKSTAKLTPAKIYNRVFSIMAQIPLF